ncbi:hypothetical protein LJC23_02835 [Desulfovibrio sp. OttesenSCG-928-I05]|nr:hypothetical protein [Desulfovibrio sp. OttesenSCG-928-I05]
MVPLFCLGLFVGSAGAENITWNGVGDAGNTGALNDDPSTGPGKQSLYPTSPSDNTVTVNGDVPGVVYGGVDYVSSGGTAATSSGNSVTFNGGDIGSGGSSGGVYGGYTHSDSGGATASGNTATLGVNAGEVHGEVYGGSAVSNSGVAKADGNTTSVGGGQTLNSVIGGYARSEFGTGTNTANDNSLTVSGGDIGGDVHGGFVDSTTGNSTASGNQVFISGGNIGDSDPARQTGNVFGSWANSQSGMSTVGDSKVTIGGGNIKYSVYGARARSANDSAVASGISVSIYGGDIGSRVFGAEAYTGEGSTSGAATATGISVGINGVSIGGRVDGGYAYSYYGTATTGDIDLTVSNSNVSGAIYGGYANSYQGSGAATASGVKMTVQGGIVGGNTYGGYARSYSGTSTVGDIDLTVSDSNVSGLIYGGYANSYRGTEAATTSGVKMTVQGGTVGGDTYGGYAYSYGGTATTGGVDLTVSGSDISGSIYGGYANSYDGSVVSNHNVTITDKDANGNVIGPSTLRGSIYGGYATAYIAGSPAEATGNTVSLSGSLIFDSNSRIYGGYTIAGGTPFGDAVTGNSLITKSEGHKYSLAGIANFENYDFTVTSADVNTGPIFTVTDQVLLSGKNVTLRMDDNSQPMRVGDVVTMFSHTDGVPTYTINTRMSHSGLLDYSVDDYFGSEGLDSFNVTIRAAKSTPETVILGHGQLAGLQMVNAASNLATKIPALYNLAANSRCAGADWQTGRPVAFAGVEGGRFRWNAGGDSSLALNHLSLLAGLGWKVDDLLLAAYFESGWGSYDSQLSGRTYADDQNANYIGGGLRARYDLGAFYGEAGFHAGEVKADFNTYLQNGSYHSTYDFASAYVGADLALGYRVLVGNSELDLSAAYLWNRVNGERGRSGTSVFRFGSSDSQRVKAGGRWLYNGFDQVAPYAGAYFEYEFDAKSVARFGDYNLRGASMRGGSGIGQIGLRFKSQDCRFTVDIGLEGSVGQRRGTGGQAVFSYSF